MLKDMEGNDHGLIQGIPAFAWWGWWDCEKPLKLQSGYLVSWEENIGKADI